MLSSVYFLRLLNMILSSSPLSFLVNWSSDKAEWRKYMEIHVYSPPMELSALLFPLFSIYDTGSMSHMLWAHQDPDFV